MKKKLCLLYPFSSKSLEIQSLLIGEPSRPFDIDWDLAKEGESPSFLRQNLFDVVTKPLDLKTTPF